MHSDTTKENEADSTLVSIELKSSEGESVGAPAMFPLGFTVENFEQYLNMALKNVLSSLITYLHFFFYCIFIRKKQSLTHSG